MFLIPHIVFASGWLCIYTAHTGRWSLKRMLGQASANRFQGTSHALPNRIPSIASIKKGSGQNLPYWLHMSRVISYSTSLMSPTNLEVWAGAVEIDRVEFSSDHGTTWSKATLERTPWGEIGCWAGVRKCGGPCDWSDRCCMIQCFFRGFRRVSARSHAAWLGLVRGN